MSRYVQTAFPAEPTEQWTQPIDFSNKLAGDTPAANPVVEVSDGHTGATAEVGSYDAETGEWTPTAEGQWVLVSATAESVPGERFLITVRIDTPNGVVSFYKPITRHS